MSLFANSRPSTVPKADWIHAHCDGGSRGNPGPSGFGAVITDASGDTLAELSKFLGIRTNNFAEYSGLLAVLDWAIANGQRHVKVVSDSELMVKQIQGKYKVKSPDLKTLWDMAQDKIRQLDKFEISHALRHKNQAADALANQAMDRGMRRGVSVVVDELPPSRSASPPPASIPPPEALADRSRHAPIEPREPASRPTRPTMLRGAIRNGVSVMPDGLPADRPASDRALQSAPVEPREPDAHPLHPTMLRGFTKNGSVHILGSETLPDGIFVKIIRE